MLHAGDVLQNRYEILKVIGKGGMSTVYQARDLKTNNLLAVKDVARSGQKENQEMEQKLAVAEGQMLKQLDNPHLPKIYEIIDNQDSFMLVMDYIHGVSLDKVIAKSGAQPVELVLNWGMQICEVFHYLHNQPTPIIYRDMKPANVILKPDGNLMMIDFGTARTLKQGVAMQADTICIGTAGFAAPEQFGGIGQSTERTDIFCLGATLYNLVTGHSPCDRPVGILPLETWNPAFANTPISEIIIKATRNDPNERYQTAMELYEDLRLASTGAYKKVHGKGKSGQLGGFRSADWQKQDVKGNGMVSGGLSSLIQKGITAHIGSSRQDVGADTQNGQYSTYNTSGWGQNQSQAASGAGSENGAAYQQADAQHASDEGQRWRKLIMIAAIVAVLFVVFAVVFALIQQIVAAMVFLIFALGGAVLALVGALMLKRLG